MLTFDVEDRLAPRRALFLSLWENLTSSDLALVFSRQKILEEISQELQSDILERERGSMEQL